jgi:hypothetical protein
MFRSGRHRGGACGERADIIDGDSTSRTGRYRVDTIGGGGAGCGGNGCGGCRSNEQWCDDDELASHGDSFEDCWIRLGLFRIALQHVIVVVDNARQPPAASRYVRLRPTVSRGHVSTRTA